MDAQRNYNDKMERLDCTSTADLRYLYLLSTLGLRSKEKDNRQFLPLVGSRKKFCMIADRARIVAAMPKTIEHMSSGVIARYLS